MLDGADAKPSGTKITKTHGVLRQRRDVRFSTVYKRKFRRRKDRIGTRCRWLIRFRYTERSKRNLCPDGVSHILQINLATKREEKKFRKYAAERHYGERNKSLVAELFLRSIWGGSNRARGRD